MLLSILIKILNHKYCEEIVAGKLVEVSSSCAKMVLYPDRSLGKCKLGRMECMNWSET